MGDKHFEKRSPHSNAESATARFIAQNLAWLSQDKVRGVFVPRPVAELARSFARHDSARGRLKFNLFMSSRLRWLIALLERFMLPGLQLHFALRKLYIEEIARQAFDAGASQLVVIGGGFDTLAVRLSAQFQDKNFIEIDQSVTQGTKREVLRRGGYESNVHFIPANLAAETIDEVLGNNPNFHRNARTLYLAEGLLMYLTAAQVADVFAGLKRCGAKGDLFLWTFMQPLEDNRIAFRNSNRYVDGWLQKHREPFKWSIEQRQVADFLHAHGFNLRRLATPDTLRQTYLAPRNLAHLLLAEGENLCLAELA
ncbi:MAG: SAM-dependent methyltransferase [Pyrinomonadaceae bacterium MAG19_C2-C3]|nr:SAM-dependent methyltransferase [Pyrinomonadaceae bacterium MAG19_C2-C3]